jgi:flagellar basal-body rod protein FlgC
MSLFDVFKLSTQGMSAQRLRLETATANLANANTTRTAEGGPYRRRDTVFESVALTAAADSAATHQHPEPLGAAPLEGVRATTQLAAAGGVIKRYQPNHPDADAQGYVALPDVDALEETVNILSAARSFEANATAFSTAKELARISLKLGENA